MERQAGSGGRRRCGGGGGAEGREDGACGSRERADVLRAERPGALRAERTGTLRAGRTGTLRGRGGVVLLDKVYFVGRGRDETARSAFGVELERVVEERLLDAGPGCIARRGPCIARRGPVGLLGARTRGVFTGEAGMLAGACGGCLCCGDGLDICVCFVELDADRVADGGWVCSQGEAERVRVFGSDWVFEVLVLDADVVERNGRDVEFGGSAGRGRGGEPVERVVGGDKRIPPCTDRGVEWSKGLVLALDGAQRSLGMLQRRVVLVELRQNGTHREQRRSLVCSHRIRSPTGRIVIIIVIIIIIKVVVVGNGKIESRTKTVESSNRMSVAFETDAEHDIQVAERAEVVITLESAVADENDKGTCE